MAFGLYTDAGLTTLLATNVIFEEPVDHSATPSDVTLYLGSPDVGKKLNALSDPGVDQITVSILDSSPGSGHEDTEIKLATTEAGLATATGGDALDLGVEILSEVGNAAEIWIRSRDATSTQGTSTELSIATNDLGEYDQ
ncbi:MAG: hypothetical protein GY799_26880 [Desulfobulbaceae bacterium]|nr:hypothetical protein [Desulfobulbaceae bacterium]